MHAWVMNVSPPRVRVLTEAAGPCHARWRRRGAAGTARARRRLSCTTPSGGDDCSVVEGISDSNCPRGDGAAVCSTPLHYPEVAVFSSGPEGGAPVVTRRCDGTTVGLPLAASHCMQHRYGWPSLEFRPPPPWKSRIRRGAPLSNVRRRRIFPDVSLSSHANPTKTARKPAKQTAAKRGFLPVYMSVVGLVTFQEAAEDVWRR